MTNQCYITVISTKMLQQYSYPQKDVLFVHRCFMASKAGGGGNRCDPHLQCIPCSQATCFFVIIWNGIMNIFFRLWWLPPFFFCLCKFECDICLIKFCNATCSLVFSMGSSRWMAGNRCRWVLCLSIAAQLSVGNAQQNVWKTMSRSKTVQTRD